MRSDNQRNHLTEVSSPPDHFKTVGTPAFTDVGTDVKLSWDCARAAMTNEAPMNKLFMKYIPIVMDGRNESDGFTQI